MKKFAAWPGACRPQAIPLGGLARNLYAMHSIAGNGALDFSSIIKTVLK